MEDLEGLKELVRGSQDLARVQNLVELYSYCEKNSTNEERTQFTKLVEASLIDALKLGL